jgi:hypothetical protein
MRSIGTIAKADLITKMIGQISHSSMNLAGYPKRMNLDLLFKTNTNS